jgi:hypothetical protein
MQYKSHVFQKLQAALNSDFEIALTERLPPDYSRRLPEIKDPDYTPPSEYETIERSS